MQYVSDTKPTMQRVFIGERRTSSLEGVRLHAVRVYRRDPCDGFISQ